MVIPDEVAIPIPGDERRSGREELCAATTCGVFVNLPAGNVTAWERTVFAVPPVAMTPVAIANGRGREAEGEGEPEKVCTFTAPAWSTRNSVAVPPFTRIDVTAVGVELLLTVYRE